MLTNQRKEPCRPGPVPAPDAARLPVVPRIAFGPVGRIPGRPLEVH